MNGEQPEAIISKYPSSVDDEEITCCYNVSFGSPEHLMRFIEALEVPIYISYDQW